KVVPTHSSGPRSRTRLVAATLCGPKARSSAHSQCDATWWIFLLQSIMMIGGMQLNVVRRLVDFRGGTNLQCNRAATTLAPNKSERYDSTKLIVLIANKLRCVDRRSQDRKRSMNDIGEALCLLSYPATRQTK